MTPVVSQGQNPSSSTDQRSLPLWDWLTAPAPSITDPEERYKARLLSGLLLLAAVGCALVVFVYLPLLAANAGEKFFGRVDAYIDISYVVGLFVAYGWTRTRQFSGGGYFALVISLAIVVADVALKPDYIYYNNIVIFLTIQFMIASFFLRYRQLVGLAFLYVITLTLTALLIPRITFIIYLTPMPFILLMLLSTLLYLRHRDIQERLRQARLEAALQKTEALYEISQAISSTLDFDDVLQRIAEQMCIAVDATSAYICDFVEESLVATVLAEYIGPNACDKEKVSDLGVAYSEESLLTADFLRRMRAGRHDYAHVDDSDSAGVDRLHMEQYGGKTILYIPLRAQGQLIGYTEVWESRTRREFTPDEIAICHSIAQHAASALENAQLHRQLQQHATDLEKRVEERTADLEKTNQQLRLVSELKDEFVANVSHELRTPLASIKLYLHLLRVRPADGARYLTALERESERLQMIVEDLLFLSRLDKQVVSFKLVTCDLNNLAETIVADRMPLAKENGLALRLETASDLPPVLADKARLEKAFSNLLTNAFNYTPEGGQIMVATEQRHCQDGLWAGISVADTGPGIEADEMPDLFERFFRGKQGMTSGKPGTGLGLPIAKEIVDRHGGKLEVCPNGGSGCGVQFTIWLPGTRVETDG